MRRRTRLSRRSTYRPTGPERSRTRCRTPWTNPVRDRSMASSLTATNRVHAILATDDHADAIATFYREAWGEPATPEIILAARRTAAAENVAVPGEPPPIALVLEGSRVI